VQNRPWSVEIFVSGDQLLKTRGFEGMFFCLVIGITVYYGHVGIALNAFFVLT